VRFVSVKGNVRGTLAVFISLILAQCAMVDTIDGRFAQINRSSAVARNESILLNIVRASHNVPLNFVAASRISGSTTATLGGGLPSILTGPYPIATGAAFATGVGQTVNVVEPALTRDVGLNSTTLNASANAANSFDLTVLESKEFYSALLSPVDLPTVNFFIRQGYPHELLFWLFTESVRETVGGHTFEYRNLASQPCENVMGNERCFKDMVDVAVTTGLTVETRTVSGAFGGSEGKPARSPSIVYARLCFDPVLAHRAQKEYEEGIRAKLYGPVEGHRPRCGTWRPPSGKSFANLGGDTDTLTFEMLGAPYGPVKYQIITRSTFGIYQFLGRLLAEQAADAVHLRGRRNTSEDSRILSVSREFGSGPCFVEIRFEGEYYCVPEHGAQYTKRIFSLLAQLLALKTQTGDLAITPVVRVSP
jgi:hypothetical protein